MIKFLATLAIIGCSILGIQTAEFRGSKLNNGPDTAPNCTFNYNWCGWTTAASSGHGWLRVPDKNHDRQRGWYIIFNGAIHSAGQFVNITSPPVWPARRYCFNFWLSTLQFARSAPNKLQVVANIDSSAIRSRSYTLNTGSRWTYQSFQVFTNHRSVSFSMIASKPTFNNGYIAVDDIRVIQC